MGNDVLRALEIRHALSVHAEDLSDREETAVFHGTNKKTQTLVLEYFRAS